MIMKSRPRPRARPSTIRVAKFKCPGVLGVQKISEDNHKLRLAVLVLLITRFFCERIYPKMFIPTNLSSYRSLANKNNSMRTSTTYI